MPPPRHIYASTAHRRARRWKRRRAPRAAVVAAVVALLALAGELARSFG